MPLVYGNALKNGEINAPAYTNNGATYSNDFVNSRDVQITSPYIEENEGCAVASCGVILQDVQDMVTELCIIDGSDCRFLCFTVAEVPALNGNAIIGVKDAGGNILWSWHIWCCTDNLTPLAFVNYTGVEYKMMPINLGQIWDNAEKTRGRNPHFQWGRKDPILPGTAYNSNTNATLYGEKTYGTAAAATIGEAIKNPHKFFLQDGETYYNWFTGGSKYNLWNAAITAAGTNDDQATVIKTVYDPCPVGFMMPAGRAFTGFTTTGGNTSTASQFNVLGSFTAGWLFKLNAEDTVGNFFPTSGYRNRTSGALGGVGGIGNYWSFAAHSQTNAYHLNFNSGIVNPLNSTYRASGFSVRACQEY